MSRAMLIVMLPAVAIFSLYLASEIARAQWKPADARLLTPWAKDVSPEDAHKEYPRPQMVRVKWMNLNGLWDYALRPKGEQWNGEAAGQILVPFPIESALSGVNQRVSADQRLWYRRTFKLPGDWKDQRLLLHFEAVDWEANVWVNGHHVGSHRGGYAPFSFDVTTALQPDGQEQEIVVAVWDPTSDGDQPRGKQIDNPHGIWYTPTTGIWATVWLEPVPKQAHIRSVKITPDLDTGQVTLEADHVGKLDRMVVGATLTIDRQSKKTTATIEPNQPLKFTLSKDELKPWSPDSPHLYELLVNLREFDKQVDEVRMYFAMRKIEVAKDDKGVNRLMLNNEPVFQYGTLDQGFWPDGLYTAPTDEALRYDLEMTKKLGFNMVRKHVKVEPRRWYYWCDKLGLMVWQDMPSGDRYIGPSDPDIERIAQSANQFENELKEVIDTLYNHPSIVMWVPFNEGWGQYDTERITKWVKGYDPTRLVNNTSGWSDRGVGDVHDVHAYPGPAMPPVEANRVAVLGEFGGLGLPMPGHTWQDEKNWGYRSFDNKQALTDAYVNLLTRMRPLIGEGLSAAVYTQTTDVEIEVNGVMTYDRKVVKIDPDRALEAARKLHLPPPSVKVVVPTARKSPVQWRYTTEQPADNWYLPDFNDARWKSGASGFGTSITPGAVVGTTWDSEDIWIRRTFDLPDDVDLGTLHLLIHHDEDATLYINGQAAGTIQGYTSNYILEPLSEQAKKAIRPGQPNHIAIHCHNTAGGQFIDVGFVTVVENRP